MVVSILLAMLTLRSGLALRRARLRTQRLERGARERHLRLAKISVAMIIAGFGAKGEMAGVVLKRTPNQSLEGYGGRPCRCRSARHSW